ncbi:MAG TPA: hypothetical protein VJM31_00435 [Vicinamibacterales bacterium]|nr:hypothetical protein [Vicinamibacterales bacterium]
MGERYGSRDAVESLIFQPLSSDKKMETVDGQPFDAKIECQAQSEFMRVSFAPSSANDLQFVAIELDQDLDGRREYSTMVPGPIAAVCTNGALVCDPGTTTNCRGKQWRAAAEGLVADDVAKDQLGGCYCFNNGCGAGLLGTNSRQVLGDLGSGIATALQREFPRLSVGSAQQVDATTMQFYGQSSGCGQDARPEQYFGTPESIRAAGETAAADPSSTYYKLTHSNVATEQNLTEQQCEVRRVVELQDKALDVGSVLSLNGGQNLTTSACGPRCLDIQLGRSGNEYLSARCGSHSDIATWTLHRPEMIASAVLTFVSFDDYVSSVFDESRIVYSEPGGWDGLTQRCGENRNRGTRTPNIDVTAYLNAKVPGSTWRWRNTIWLTDDGDGYSVLRLRFHDDCELARESVDDGCSALEANVQCNRRDEQVDGVQTYRDYYSTGLWPLPSSHEVTHGSCHQRFTRDWWLRTKTYACEGAARQFDARFSTERHAVISSSFNKDTGAFEDLRTGADGTPTRPSMTTPLPPSDDASCQRMCKTRKPRPGQAMGEVGSTGQLNPSTPAWDYTYRDCTVGDICPVGAGEDIVAACNCDSTFAEAVSMMQTIRMTAQDTQCRAP